MLNAQVREAGAKAKRLRREGMVPGVLFGKRMDESMPLQFKKNDVEQFLRENMVGSRVELVVNKKKYSALLKSITYRPVIRDVEHLNFQALVAGEPVISEFHIHLHNRAKVDGIVQQHLSEVRYRALPSKLVEVVNVELEGKVPGDSALLGDLDFVNNPDFEILTPLDTSVYSIVPRKMAVEAEPAAAEEGKPAAEEAE